VHRQGARDDHLARQVAGLSQHVVDPGPVHGQQERVRSLSGLSRCARPRFPFGVPRELLQLLLPAGVAEYHLMSGAREERAELAAHQSRTEKDRKSTRLNSSHRTISYAVFCLKKKKKKKK